MMTLYSLTYVNWPTKMFDVVDSVKINHIPQYDNNRWWIGYFMCLQIVFNFFIVNVFVGVVVSTFNEQKEKYGKNFLLTDK